MGQIFVRWMLLKLILVVMHCPLSLQGNNISFSLMQDSEESCPLLQFMDILLCDVGDGELDNMKEMVPEGTVCFFDSGGETPHSMECVDKAWVDTANLKGTRLIETREKRAIGLFFSFLVASAIVHCISFCHKNEKQNSRPYITCPSFQKVMYPDKGQGFKKVTWSPAAAQDVEDGTLSAYMTSGEKPGSFFSEGNYQVSYMAKDSGGLTQSCTSHFTVKVHRCSRLYTFLINGQASCSAYTSYGSICTYSCNPGYKLIGSSYSECLQTWTREKPVCAEDSCGQPSSITNGNLSCSEYTYNSECRIICDFGYSLKGSSSIECQSNNQWTSPEQCVDILPPTIHCNKSLHVYTRPNQTQMTVTWEMPTASDNSGERVRVTSEPSPGVNLTVGTHRVTFIGVDTAGLTGFCHMIVHVQVIKCNTSESNPDFAKVTCSKDNIYGSECIVVCHEGYELEGDATRVCQENGTWTGNTAKCKGKPCTGLPLIAGGHYNCPRGQGYQDVCSLVCFDGYKFIAPLTITCTIDGNWTLPGSCNDVQAPMFPHGCSPDMRVDAGQLGGAVNVTYKLPDSTDNTGEIVHVWGEPLSGSEFDLGFTNVTITAQDITGNQATCQFLILVGNISCEEPNFDNGTKLMNYDCPDKYIYGATCSLSCPDNHFLQGARTITCDKLDNKNKLGWTWKSNAAPFCKPDICPKLKEPNNGTLTCASIVGGRGQQCALACNNNYMHPKTAQDMFVCYQINGQWSRGGYVADCLPRRKAKSALARPCFHYQGSICYMNNTEIKKKFTAALHLSKFKNACPGKMKCSVTNVTVSCTKTADPNHVINEFVAEIMIKPFEDKGSALHTQEFYNLLVEQINSVLILEADDNNFILPEVGPLEHFEHASLILECDPGTQLVSKTMSCAGCGEGYMYENSTQSCIPCPFGTYQSNEIAFSCTHCPQGMTTTSQHSVSQKQCISLCKPGEISITGFEPCNSCPRGSYQPNPAMRKCDLCPFGMTTLSEGSTSMQDCLFYNIRMSQGTLQPSIELAGSNFDTFTLLMWVHSVTTNDKKILTFTMDTNLTTSESAYFSLGSAKLYVTLQSFVKAQSIRKWYHIAIVCRRKTAILYVHGREIEKFVNFDVRDLTQNTFWFSTSDSIRSIIISGIQMTHAEMSVDQVKEFSMSFNKRVNINILTVHEVDLTLISASSCDDIDDCLVISCGEFGTCIDEPGQASCVCEEPWSGVNCQVVPDFCLDHKCHKGSSCVNSPRDRSYTCACPVGYKGAFCQEKAVNGNWGLWEEWGPCSVTCDSGQRSRIRECNNPRPDRNGEDCHGSGIEQQNCEEKPCAVDGGWGTWSDWACSVTCGNGTMKRYRQCNSPSPASAGLACLGASSDFSTCMNGPCPVDGRFGAWSDWTQCSVTCGGGFSRRVRICDSPPPSKGGKECDRNLATESRTCNSHTCPVCRELTTDTVQTTFMCIHNKKSDMKICNITCQSGMMMLPDDLNEFKCGRLTNYTWSHQTKNNPIGILPTCTDVKIPSTQKSKLIIQFDNIDCKDPPTVPDFTKSVNNNLEENIACMKNGECNSSVTATLSCEQKLQLSDNGSIEVMVVMDVPHFGKHDSYLRFLSEEELNAQLNRLNLIENMTLQLMNQRDKIAKININDTIYTGSAQSAKMEVTCQYGSGFINGVCVDCPARSFSDGNGSCLLCGKGFYQDMPRQSLCTRCPEGLSTSGTGQTSPNDCMADPPDYMDYFDWAFDDVYETVEEPHVTTDPSTVSVPVLDNNVIIGIVIVVAFFLAVICTWIIIVTVKCAKMKIAEDTPSIEYIYENELYQKHVVLAEVPYKEDIYDVIDLDSMKEATQDL